MFSKYRLIGLGISIFFIINLIVISTSIKKKYSSAPGTSFVLSVVSPFQEVGIKCLRLLENMWSGYFALASVAKENDILKEKLRIAIEKENWYREIELENQRLKNLLEFKASNPYKVLVAEVIGKDPSPWFKSVTINKGSKHGIQKGMPVVVPEGIAGIVTDTAINYSKILLLIDSNFGADALVQRSRVRGIVKGESVDKCYFQFVLRRHDVKVGDVIVSSGLDRVFPKGLVIGDVSEVNMSTSDIFQEVVIIPRVDFERLEEVLIITASLTQEGDD